MNITAIEPSNILSQLLSPIVLTFIATILATPLSAIIVRYYSLRDKNQYAKLLKLNFSPIKVLKSKITKYKINSLYEINFLFVGFLFGFIIVLCILYVTIHIRPNVTVMTFGLFLYILIILIIRFSMREFRWFRSSKLSMSTSIEDGSAIDFSLLSCGFRWVYIGMIFTVNIIIYYLIYYYSHQILYEKVTFSFSLTYLENAYTAISSYIPHLEMYGLFYFIGLIYSLYSICRALIETISDYKRTIELITNFYKCSFPYIKIKTDSGEVKGQLTDIYNKSLVTLSEDGLLKIIPLDKIEIMEVRHPKKDEYIAFDDDFIKK